MAFQDFNNSIDTLYQQLVVQPMQELNRLPEHIFAGYFLPLFTGKINDPKRITEWISIAGSPGREVSIIDAGNTELFRVPALMDMENTSRVLPEGSVTITQIVALTDALMAQSPHKANDIFKKELTKRIKENHKLSKNHLEKTQRWIAIFERYGIESVDKKKATTPAVDPGAVGEDEFEME